MDLVQQFLQLNVGKIKGQHLQEKIQECQNGVQQLLDILGSLRKQPKLILIDLRIVRVDNFINLKQDITSIIQDQDDDILWQWITSTLFELPLLKQIINKQWIQVKTMLHQIVRDVFLPKKSIEKFIEGNQIGRNYLLSLQQLKKSIQNNKTPVRETLRNIDRWFNPVEQQIYHFHTMVADFNLKVSKLFKKLFQFQDYINNQFQTFFQKEIQGEIYNIQINSKQTINQQRSQYQSQSLQSQNNLAYFKNKSNISKSNISKSAKNSQMKEQSIGFLGCQSNFSALSRNKGILRTHNKQVSSQFE